MKLRSIVRSVVRFVQDCWILWIHRRPGERLVLASWLPVRNTELVRLVQHDHSNRVASIAAMYSRGRGPNGALVAGYAWCAGLYVFAATTPCLSSTGFGLKLRIRRVWLFIRNCRILWINRQSGERLTTVSRAYNDRHANGIRLVTHDQETGKSEVCQVRVFNTSLYWAGIIDYDSGSGFLNSSCGTGEPCLVLKRKKS